MLIAFKSSQKDTILRMTDSMNFGPDWIRNLSSESGTGGGGTGSIARYQLAEYRYGREEMLALFDRNIKPPACLGNFKSLYSEVTLPPLALIPITDEERGGNWQNRPGTLGSGPPRGRGGSLERGSGRGNRGGRGNYPSYGRTANYEGGWGGGGNGESSDWSPRKEYQPRPASMDNWRRSRGAGGEDDDGWRIQSGGRGMHDKWGRSTSWRGDGEPEERSGPPERGGRSNWHDLNRAPHSRRFSEHEDHNLPEWANEHPHLESGGSFDDRGAFHGSDEEESLEGGGGLQKSASHQYITQKAVHAPLLSSKSTLSLVKDGSTEKNDEDNDPPNVNSDMVKENVKSSEIERKLSVPEISEKAAHEAKGLSTKERAKSEGPPKTKENRAPANVKQENKPEVSDFERLQEDFVLKLMVDEEPAQRHEPAPDNHANYETPSLPPPPPNMAVPGQDKWFYQDPQGQMQGPFTNMEMSEWFKAGYFGQDLKVRRQSDERFFLLGELMAMCGGGNPFHTSIRFPVLKNDVTKMSDSDVVQFQYLSQLMAYKQAQARVLADPWSSLTLQQQELAAQKLIMQHQQVPQDLQFMPQASTNNPLMQMINQMQQANKLPNPGLLNKHPPNIDPHLHMQMSNFLSLQNRIPATSGLPNHVPAGMPNKPENLPGIPGTPLGGATIPIQGLPSGLAGGLGLNVPRPTSVEHPPGQDPDPISSLLKQLQQHKQQHNQVEAMWSQNQFGSTVAATQQQQQQQQQWPAQQQQEVSLSMWDLQHSPQHSHVSQNQQAETQSMEQQQNSELAAADQLRRDKSKDRRQKEEEKELKKKKKLEEEQQKKEAEERRKQEQRKLEADKRAEAERKRKEEERIKRELEKTKKEAEEKRLKELEEKRRLKEQRKVEEARKREEEEKKMEEERAHAEREQSEREERRRDEEVRHEAIPMAKVAPWSQANSTLGTSLAEIQKAEKERRAAEAALQAQRAQLEKEIQLQQQQQQQQLERAGGWAKKAMEPRKVKSLVEIQAEEQERLAKEATEARLRKEKEARENAPLLQTTASSKWSGHNLTWGGTNAAGQWASAMGLWEEPPAAPQLNKPSHLLAKPSSAALTKSSSMTTFSTSGNAKQQSQSVNKQAPKAKQKKEESAASIKKNNNNNIDDEFTSWCHTALANISSNVDIPTFVTFLRDIESAYEVKDYCKEYLGEGNSTHQFVNSFLEKRRAYKNRHARKDEAAAPIITPSTHHNNSTEFQEVKGKNKKSKKSKMLKVDSRILGFNVTSAPDRINVGDRDYGDNS